MILGIAKTESVLNFLKEDFHIEGTVEGVEEVLKLEPGYKEFSAYVLARKLSEHPYYSDKKEEVEDDNISESVQDEETTITEGMYQAGEETGTSSKVTASPERTPEEEHVIAVVSKSLDSLKGIPFSELLNAEVVEEDQDYLVFDPRIMDNELIELAKKSENKNLKWADLSMYRLEALKQAKSFILVTDFVEPLMVSATLSNVEQYNAIYQSLVDGMISGKWVSIEIFTGDNLSLTYYDISKLKRRFAGLTATLTENSCVLSIV